jgi:hypothetical protein
MVSFLFLFCFTVRFLSVFIHNSPYVREYQKKTSAVMVGVFFSLCIRKRKEKILENIFLKRPENGGF